METPQHNVPSELPTGVVTLLFTDIAGSTRLWEQHGDRFIPAWQTHDAVLRDAFARFHGVEVKSEGDSFMVAFTDPNEAVRCALFAQAALARYPWPRDIGAIRVRMGLHTGEPFVHDDDYFGPAVNLAANTCKAAHGGQVLVTEETRRAADSLDLEIEFSDLGGLRLKDMGSPQRLYQAEHPDLRPMAFPAPRTLDAQPNNLPVQRTSFVGRAREIEQIAAYLAEGKKPVLTITGPGGIGKTRLSLQAAANHSEWFPDGVWYIDLVRAHDVIGAAVEIAGAMNIPLDPAHPPLPQVRAWLAGRQCLLILDDANTLPHADRLIRELLSGSTGLRCLATTRESLEIAEAEHLVLSGLPTLPQERRGAAIGARHIGSGATAVEPSQMEETTPGHPTLGDADAGRLLLERLAEQAALPLTSEEAAAARQLLSELEGVPLNVERAARLMDRVSPSVVLDWLNHRLAEDRVQPRTTAGMGKVQDLLRRGAAKVRSTMEGTTHASAAGLAHLLQGIANVATDRNEHQQAARLGRESLQISHESGDMLGVAAALRQLARVRWRQGDRRSATAMLTAAAQIYRRHNAEEYGEVERELDRRRAELEPGISSPQHTVEEVITLAMNDSSGH